MTSLRRLNEEFIAILGELHDIMLLQGEPFRARAYGKAQETVMAYAENISQAEQLKDHAGIGVTILSKLNEYVTTGTLKILEKERKNPLNILAKVYGVGPKKAKELVETHGITSIAALRIADAKDQLLNDKQKIGLAYFEEIEERIPRSEIDEYAKVFNAALPAGASYEIVGSYRRGAVDSGDIDVIITTTNTTTTTSNNKTIFVQFVDALIKNKTIVEVLSRGASKSMTLGALPPHPPSLAVGKRVARRVDFMYSPPDEYAFAILYFTGSKIFNTVQRQRAQDLGYTLNEHGIYHFADGKKGEKVAAPFPDEKSIFDFLKMEYRAPNERKDGRSVTILQAQHMQTQAQHEQTQQQTPTEKVEVALALPKKIKKTTLKKKLIIIDCDNTSRFKTQGLSALKIMTENELSSLIREANTEYYCNHSPIMTDNEYDILLNYTRTHYPENAAAKEGHMGGVTPPPPHKEKFTGSVSCVAIQTPPASFTTRGSGQVQQMGSAPLPYQMWSMDKIKPDTDALPKWCKKYKGPYVISCKVDGVSGLYTTEGPEPKLYTRGDGTTGQDVSHIIPYLKLPTTANITVRGEFIITKALFQSKYAATFANPRNFVAGVINKKTIDADKYRDLSFVIYEVIHPVMKPSEQLKFLATTNNKLDIIQHIKSDKSTAAELSELLIQWRADYAYEIDGLICMNDAIYPRPTGNPDYAFAFKMVLSDQVAESFVVDVIWTPSKDGYLKPRVQINPIIKLGGVDIEYATGFNAKFIEENKIGVGALIRLIRSGDVIPHITDVIQPASAPLMPDPATYKWNDTHVDIVLIDKEDNQVVKEKNITGFFTNIGVDGLAGGNIKRIMHAGFDTIPKIIAMTKEDLLAVEGFKEKMAQKVHSGIYAKLQEVSLPELMHATNIFGRGFGTKKLASILNELPDILTTTSHDKVKMISTIPGMATTTAEKFVDKIDEFLEFMKQAKLTDKLLQQQHKTTIKTTINTSHPLYKKKYVITGFRDKELIAQLDAVGAEQASSVSKNTFVVIVKDLSESTGKVDEAIKLNIPIMTSIMVIEKYFYTF